MQLSVHHHELSENKNKRNKLFKPQNIMWILLDFNVINVDKIASISRCMEACKVMHEVFALFLL